MKKRSKEILLIALLIFAFVLYGCKGSGDWSLPGAADNVPPKVVITSPLTGDMTYAGVLITFTGSATDPEDGALGGSALIWTSDRDGQIGTGNTFDTAALSVGTHVITLAATDQSGAQGTASITITIRPAWSDAQWGFRQEITISSSMAPSDQTDFPVLIKITDDTNPVFANALASGDDILFTSDDGVTRLDHEIELYDNAGTGELDAWVRIPILSSTVDTVIFMYYGNAGAASQENAAGVWDSNFTMVHHLEETSGAHLDSTSRGNNYPTVVVTAQGTAPGKVNGADEFDGIDDSVTWGQLLRNLLDPVNNVGTMEVWMRPRGAPVSRDVMYDLPASIGDNWGSTGVFRGIYPIGGEDRIWLSNWASEYCIVGTTYNVDEWTYIVWLKTADTLYIYKDGVESGSVPCSMVGDGRLMIGRNWPGGTSFNGLVDEVRTSNIDRSSEWIETCFNNQDDPLSFLIFNTVEIY